MKQPDLLMLFVRNPVLGKVKTRLAASVGPELALDIYLHLLQHTRKVTQNIKVDKVVYYSDKIEQDDLWPANLYQKKVQLTTGDLGEKMAAAFSTAFSEGYTSVVIIGSDCQQLTQSIIQNAFLELQTYDIVVGPALDGGYYLLGMKQFYPELFQHKRWSTESVFTDTLRNIESMHLSYKLLPRLSDVDYVEDLNENFLS